MPKFALLALVLAGCSATKSFQKPVSPPRAETKQEKGVIPITDIDSDSLGPAKAKFDELAAAGQKDVWFRLNSFGGEIFGGWDFVQAIEDAKKAHHLTVTCVVDTRAMSMGAVFLESFCDKRLMTKRSVLLFHEGKSGMEDGDVRKFQSALARLKALNESIAETVSSRMGMPLEEYRKRTDGLDWTLASKEALKVHAVDGLISPNDIPPPYELAAPNQGMDFLKILTGRRR